MNENAVCDFSWTISPNKMMEWQSYLLIESADSMANAHIAVQEKELPLISHGLRRMANVWPYQCDSDMVLPWSSTPKWRINPTAKVVVGLDADVVLWRKDLLYDIVKSCLKEDTIYGTIGYRQPIPLTEWQTLYRIFNIKECFEFQYTNTQEACPFYINNGAVMMPTNLLPHFRDVFYHVLPFINRRYKDHYFMSQIATSIAISKAGFKVKALPRTFNYTEFDNPELPLLSEAVFFHYNISRRDMLNSSVIGFRNFVRHRLCPKMM